MITPNVIEVNTDIYTDLYIVYTLKLVFYDIQMQFVDSVRI